MKPATPFKALLPLAPALALLVHTAQAQWLPTYQYRKSLVINAGSGAGASYQIQVKVGESAGASGFNLQTEGHGLNFPADVRFTDNDGITELGHWLESTTGTAPNRTATFWVKVNDDLNSAQSILAYYGKSAGATGSNGTATFNFFDDFVGSAIDTGKWTIDNATGWSVTGGELRGRNSSGRIRSLSTYGGGVVLETKYRSVTRATNGNMALGFYTSANDCIGWLNHPNPDYIRENANWTNIGAECNVPVIARMTTRATQVDFTVNRQDTGAAWHNLPNRNVTVANDPIALGARYDNTLANQTYDAYWDWIRVRKSATTIPTPGAAGAEESDGLSVNVTTPANGQAFVEGTSISAVAGVSSGTAPYTVEFYMAFNGGAATLAGTANVPPYTVGLGTLAAGTYTIYSAVTDSAGVPASDTSGINTFVVDGTLPALVASNILDNVSGGPIQEDISLVTYTVTFSEDMDAGTVSAADFGNSGSATFSVGSVAETSPGVFSVPVTPTSAGTLQLRINAAADLRDLAGNALNTSSAILDDTIITVTADTTAPAPNPMTWATPPVSNTPTSITMTATTATDASGLEYFFECTAGGGDSSAWQNSPIYTDTGLPPNANCSYRVRARDKSPAQNATGYSPIASASTPMLATVSASASAPVINGLDIANSGTVTGTDKWFSGNEAGSTAAKGQTFRTGATPLFLKAFSYQTLGSVATKTYTIRVSTVSGSTLTGYKTALATQGFNYNSNDYVTWTFANPILLAANTTYGIDVAMTNSTSGWQTGIPYISYTANNYANGVMYNSGGSSAGDSNINGTGNDRIFHLDLEHPMKPTPDIGATAPAGNVSLSWTNFAPTTGTDVWVNVWFGTNPAALTQVVTAGLNTTSTTVIAPGAGTYYWRVDSYLNGASAGSPLTGDLFNFIVFDSDNDGLPDAFELANTTPPSNTALNPGDDLENGGLGDGLTNLEEFQLGTSPTNPDTDGDTLDDGPELDGVGLRAATNPLVADTDNDGFNDGAESNTAIWVSITNTGTNPIIVDTDKDGLKDGAETNTGVFVSTANTGTSPLNTNSDGDNAGDWYEVAIIDKNPALGSPPNSPNNPALKPSIPYPLPAPAVVPTPVTKPVKVYIMSGQSNMVGFGRTPGTEGGTLDTIVKRENKFPHLVTSGGAWATHGDVRYRGVVTATGDDVLKPQFGANGNSFGPEYGFGHVMGYHHDEPVLLIKSCDGSRSLLWDLAPPDSARFNFGGSTFAGYGDSPNSWTIGGNPSPYTWYAGKEYDSFFLDEEDMRPGTRWIIGTLYPNGCQLRHNGVQYISKAAHTAVAGTEPGIGADWATKWNYFEITNVVDVLDNFATDYAGPGKPFEGRTFEIAGFAWWQGYNDMSQPAAGVYEARLTSLIKHLRSYYSTRYPGKVVPNAPFVLGTVAFNGWSLGGDGAAVANAQLAVSNPALHPEFAGNVKTMEARGFYRSNGPNTNQGHHYNHNAETYLLLGDALGRAMVDLQNTAGGNTFANWMTGYPAVPPGLAGFDQDADGDGIENGVENFFGTNPGVFSAGLASGTKSSNTFTFTHPRNASPAADVSATYRWSKDLATFHAGGASDGNGTTVNFSTVTNAGITTVTAIITGTSADKLFVDVNATRN